MLRGANNWGNGKISFEATQMFLGVAKICITQDDLFHANYKITCFVYTMQDDLFSTHCMTCVITIHEMTCFVYHLK